MEKKTFKVPNIGCNGCVNTIKSELKTLSGVAVVEAAVDTKLVSVEYDNPANWELIREKLVEIDYAPELA